jgi:hypothetical protein
LFKTEEIHRRGPTLEWVAWYNGSRLLEPLGYVSPAEFEKAYHDLAVEVDVSLNTSSAVKIRIRRPSSSRSDMKSVHHCSFGRVQYQT